MSRGKNRFQRSSRTTGRKKMQKSAKNANDEKHVAHGDPGKDGGHYLKGDPGPRCVPGPVGPAGLPDLAKVLLENLFLVTGRMENQATREMCGKSGTPRPPGWTRRPILPVSTEESSKSLMMIHLMSLLFTF